MRKISTNCRLEVSFCPAFFAGFLASALLFNPEASFAQVIAAPPVPLVEPPPVIPPERDPVKLRRQKKQEQEQAEQKAVQVSKEDKAELKAEEAKKAEAQKPRPLYGFAELSLLQPKAVVSKGRSDYHCDLTSHINFYLRAFWNDEASATQPWLGWRVAPMGGYGTQNRTAARFAHTWMGPAIGVGKVSQPSDESADYPTRDMYLVSAGIAGVSRLSDPEDYRSNPPKDFESTPWSLDPPGLWSELRWTHLFFGAIGSGVLLGAQTGSGKIFYYAGVSVSGFY